VNTVSHHTMCTVQ